MAIPELPAMRQQLRPAIHLAVPVTVGQLGLMLMILVDTFIVGKLGPHVLGGVGVGSAIFYGFTLFSTGTLFGLDYFVAVAHGRGDSRECVYWLGQGTYLSLILSVLTVPAIYFTSNQLVWFGLAPEIAGPAREYLRALSWSLPPALLFVTLRQYLAAMSIVKSTAIIVIAANVVNAFLNFVLVFGNLGAPAFGAAGAGIATTGTRIVMFLSLLGIAIVYDGRLKEAFRDGALRFHSPGMKRLIKLGLPAGLQSLIRSAIFSVMALLAGHLGAVPLAAHTVVINIASFAFMVPLGISAASSVMVGQAMGRGNEKEAGAAGWTCIGLGGFTMAAFGILFYFLGGPLVGLFTDDKAVVEVGTQILLLVAAFQVVDAVQVVATGALRGLGETRAAMRANWFGLWVVGLPLSYYLCFFADAGIVGLWTGLTLGLFLVSGLVLRHWVILSRKY